MSYCFDFRSFILFFPILLLLFQFCCSDDSQSDGVGFDMRNNGQYKTALLTGAKIFMGPSEKRAGQRKKTVYFIAFLSLFSNRISIVACKMCVYHFSNKHNFMFMRVYVVRLPEIVTLTICDQLKRMKEKWEIFFFSFSIWNEWARTISKLKSLKCTLNEHLYSLFDSKALYVRRFFDCAIVERQQRLFLLPFFHSFFFVFFACFVLDIVWWCR